jgi:cobalamin synthase
MGAMFRAAKLRHVIGAWIAAAILSVLLLLIAGLGGATMWISLLGIAASAALIGSLLAVWLSRKLGGLTGDTYGAMNEAAEAACLVALCVIGKLWLF